MMAWLTRAQLEEMGFASLGENILASDKASFYNCANISVGDNVRIDDYCVLSAGDGGIQIGSFIHIAVFTLLIGGGKITLEDFANLSSRVSIYSSNDDYSGASMTNPMVPSEFTDVTHEDVSIGRHAIVGSGTIILPGVILEEGVAVGALSLITKRCEAFGVYIGNPAKRIKERKKDLLQIESKLLSIQKSQ